MTRRHATTFYWSTLLLPRSMRPHVHALYAFCRTADDLVDEDADHDRRRARLGSFGDRFLADLERGSSDDPLLAATVATAVRYGLERSIFERFLASMTNDLSVTEYPSWDALLGYMDGSAAAIADLLLPILQPRSRAAAQRPARDLGLAFQLTNFLRDVGDDLARGRVYLPQDDLARFGADPRAERDRVLDGGAVSGAWGALMRFEITRARALYRSADDGLAMLPRRAARAIGSSSVLYEGILDRVEGQGYDVFATRASVPTHRKIAAVARCAVAPRQRMDTRCA